MDKQAADTQRVLWAVVAVSLLVIVVLAGGLYFLRPQGAEKTDVTVLYADDSFDPFEHVRGDKETPGEIDRTEPIRQVTLVVGDPEQQSGSPTSPRVSTQQTVDTPSSPLAANPIPDRVAQELTLSPELQQSADRIPATDPVSVPAGRSMGALQYWIQIGSFSSRSRADELQKLARNLGYAGHITPHDTDGVTMHRVRIGPYASRPEADQLLGRLRSVNDMDGWIAQVRG